MTQFQIQTHDGPRTFCYECGASWLTEDCRASWVQCVKCGDFPERRTCPEHLMGCPPFEPFAEGETFPQLDALVRYIGQWADWQFARDGKFRGQSIIAHMRREILELELALVLPGLDPRMGETCQARRKVLDEIADIMILASHFFHQMKASPGEVVLSKMRRVTVREWGEPDEEGVIEHVRDLGDDGPTDEGSH